MTNRNWRESAQLGIGICTPCRPKELLGKRPGRSGCCWASTLVQLGHVETKDQRENARQGESLALAVHIMDQANILGIFEEGEKKMKQKSPLSIDSSIDGGAAASKPAAGLGAPLKKEKLASLFVCGKWRFFFFFLFSLRGGVIRTPRGVELVISLSERYRGDPSLLASAWQEQRRTQPRTWIFPGDFPRD